MDVNEPTVRECEERLALLMGELARIRGGAGDDLARYRQLLHEKIEWQQKKVEAESLGRL